MENESYSQKSRFEFLEDESVKKHFADANLDLLQGRHIQNDEFYTFNLIENNFDELKYYYKQLYRLNLLRDKKDNQEYFYLDFFAENKGEMGDSRRHKTLDDLQVVIGIILLNMYYVRYFEHPKIIKWPDIEEEIRSGEYKDHYQKLFFSEPRGEYDDREWSDVRRKFRAALARFDTLGWIKMFNKRDKDRIHFELRVSIHRLAILYKDELADFDQFIVNLNPESLNN